MHSNYLRLCFFWIGLVYYTIISLPALTHAQVKISREYSDFLRHAQNMSYIKAYGDHLYGLSGEYYRHPGEIAIFDKIGSKMYMRGRLNITLPSYTSPEGWAVNDRMVVILTSGPNDSTLVQVIDVSDPDRPVTASKFKKYFRILSSHQFQLAAITDRHLYVVSDSLFIFDLSDMQRPVEWKAQKLTDLLSFDREFPVDAVGATIMDNYLFTIIKGYDDTFNYIYKLAILNISNPFQPVVVSRLPLPLSNSIHGLAAHSGLVYVTDVDLKTAIISVLDPLQPALLSIFRPENGRALSNGNCVYADQDAMYIVGGLTIGNLTVGTPSLSVVDIRTPTQPVLVRTIESFYSDIALMDDAMVLKDPWRILDMSEPFQLPVVQNFSLDFIAGFPHEMHSSENRLVLTTESAFALFDISTPAEPIFLKSLLMSEKISAMTLRDNLAYLMSDTTFRIFRLDGLDAPALVGFLADARLGNAAQYGSLTLGDRYAYLLTITALSIIDISDPARPVLRSFTPGILGARATAIRFHKGFLYVTGGDSLSVIDVSDPDTPQWYTQLPITAVDIAFQDSLAFLAVRTDRYAEGGIQILDISDPVTPEPVSLIDTLYAPERIYMDTYFLVYLNSYDNTDDTPSETDGGPANIVDVSDPTKPRLIRRIPSPFTFSDINIRNNHIFAIMESDAHPSLVVYRNLGKSGDVNEDGVVSILDLMRVIHMILQVAPNPTESEVILADYLEDGAVNILDVVAMIRKILSTGDVSGKLIAGGTKALPSAIKATAEYVYVIIDTDAPAQAIQLTLSYNPDMVLYTPVPVNRAEDMILQYHVSKPGRMHIVLYGLTPDALPNGRGAVLKIPVLNRNSGQTDGFIGLTDVMVVDGAPSSIPVRAAYVDTKQTLVNKYALYQNSPNPFNPETTIFYDVPQKAHITLVVYNVLGQEVVRLVNTTQQPGRYTVTWDGRNARGQAASSGVYLYRFSSSTGFVQSRRMLLLR